MNLCALLNTIHRLMVDVVYLVRVCGAMYAERVVFVVQCKMKYVRIEEQYLRRIDRSVGRLPAELKTRQARVNYLLCCGIEQLEDGHVATKKKGSRVPA